MDMKVVNFLADALLPPRRSLRQRIMLVLGSFSVFAVAGLSFFAYLYFRDLTLGQATSRATLYFAVIAVFLLAGTILAHLLVRGITGNLERFAAHLQQFAQSPSAQRPFVDAGQDETKLVSTAFNLLLQERDTERQALCQARARVESATETRSRFIATISHELRTPLHGIIGLAQLCLESDLNGEQREQLTGILGAGKNLLHTINDLLLLQKIETGQLTLEKHDFSLRHLLDSTARDFQPPMQGKGLELQLDIPASIPDLLTGDASCLRQVLGNFLDNACKFSKCGKLTLGVNLVAEENDQVALRFFVRDQGCGISADQLQRIIHPFEMGEQTHTRRFGGAGLGLAINRQILGLLGSAMQVESTPGVGSTFSFSLTFSRQMLPPGQNALPADPRGRTALVLCKSAMAATELGGYLQRLQMRPLLAAPDRLPDDKTGAKIDLILLDGSGEENDGRKLVQQVRQFYGGHPLLVLISACGRLHAGERGAMDGVDGYLERPLTAEKLREYIFYLLAHRDPADHRLGQPPVTFYAVEASRYRLTVLVAEDIDINRKIVTSILLRHGHRVLQAVNGRQALETWRANTIDLIFMDVQMPDMDGLEATRLIRAGEMEEGRRRTPIVAVTAGNLPAEKDACMAAGMDGYLLKPFDLGEFRSLLTQTVAAKVGTEA